MSKVTMSIHRALGELKTYDDRIRNAINATFVVANKKSNDKIGGKTIKEVESMIQGNFDSVKSLIENKKRIKAAVVHSNAVTVASIAGKEYTIANAIERKAAIKLEENFLLTLKTQFTQSRNKVEYENNQLSTKLESYLQSVLGDKNARTPEDVKKYTEDYESRNKFDLIDPARVEEYIRILEKEIIDFKTEVDYVLSESNATTFVDVELED